MLETTELLGQIVRLCAEQKTGTLFLTTTENKACHIVFDQGRMVAMAYGSIRGVAVADILPRLPIQASQFNSALTMPLSTRAVLEDDSTVFDKLGLRRTESQPVMTHSQRMYRGHAVTDNATMSESKPAPAPVPDSTAETPRKSKRIYRGQVIED
jgi:hypothetical protein